MRLSLFKLVLALLPSLLLVACSSNPNAGRYSMKHDAAPDAPVDVSHVQDAVPRVEPQSRGGNKSPYQVLGKKYWVMSSSLGYREEGVASWYGRKFHGHATSNGETYDMYGMSAAHKNLPLPTYLRVTNLANSRQVIVRVNDRGPFHGNRLIDLSYAAAAKLDMLKTGTARVRIEAIDPAAWQKTGQLIQTPVAQQQTVPAAAENNGAGRYLQVASYGQESNAIRAETLLRSALSDLAVSTKPVPHEAGTLYRVHVGPLRADTSLAELKERLAQLGFTRPLLVDFP
ncbi:septal ring lytic transglycosylase RlpA family protein [Neptuniibacter sp. CAU 1671]|uniref:septal ring lytic transglycosylase RlpA family protein n=1 Tax=Neptuniibacter sp. CAU 1671 TaxID=3032593 RepID=UPI0023DB12D5|nr:septal ring lytic transglycosylase RlpA family protein [Neptuniibacter sp. CAU 1671]MDF2181718.1 septal ring lytic transglycosylase RlpA family protein [Neptuniibacter sp. CAU 1671]